MLVAVEPVMLCVMIRESEERMRSVKKDAVHKGSDTHSHTPHTTIYTTYSFNLLLILLSLSLYSFVNKLCDFYYRYCC